MARIGKHAARESESGHGGDRPWVYFMVDCFFLITEFFVLTFKFKLDESVLPQRLPPGGGGTPTATPIVNNKTPLHVHVRHNGKDAVYAFERREASENELADTLATLAQRDAKNVQVRVSYDAQTPWGDVMKVFNACTRVKIAECGLQPLRVPDR